MTDEILIAEDEPYIVESLGFVLGQSGLRVTSETDGAMVLLRVRETRPAVLILDLMLPNMNGFEILKSLKQDAALRQIPVLVLTAKGQNQDRVTAQQLGADAFITKPFSNREVLDCVRGLLQDAGGPGD